MANPNLTGVILKRNRAEHHLNALTEAIDIYKRSDPYGVVCETNAKQTEHVWKARVSSQPPSGWGPLIGDFLFNLRSCLDNLAWALAETVGTPPSDTQFPIFFTRGDWEKIRRDGSMQGPRQMEGLRKAKQAIIESLQPFNRQLWPGLIPAWGPFPARIEPMPETADFNPLWHLHSLNNVDKHRLVHVAVVVSGGHLLRFMPPNLAAGVTTEMHGGVVQDGTVIMRVFADRPLEEPNVYGDAALAIGIPQTDRSRDIIVPDGLTAMLHRVAVVIKRLTC